MLLSGSVIDNLAEPVDITLSSDSEEPSDLLEFPYFIISDRMRNALTDFGVDNIQYFQARLTVEEVGRVFDEYWLANVVGLVSCLDQAGSKSKKLRGGKGIPRKFRIDENATHGLHLFRLAENRTLIAIAEKVRAHLEKAGLHGIYYQATDQFDGKPASSFWE